MLVSGWSKGNPNINTGAGFGINIKEEDRDKFFSRNWNSVEIEIEDYKIITVSISREFWGRCSELRSKWIGKWMIEKKVAPWPKFYPPKLRLEPIKEQIFELIIA